MASGKNTSIRSNGRCTILAVGDTSPPEINPTSIFAGVKDFLKQGDIRFCQAERVFSRRGRYHPPGLARHSRRDPKCAEAYRWAGFDVVSTAGNHSGDWGFDGVIDTVRTIERLGIRSIGSGRNIDIARKPAIFEKNGVKVGFLAYASVILPQYWATADQPGVAPVRVNTYYEPYEFQPGCPARIITIPVEEDVIAMQEDIDKLRSQVDWLVVSHHWGVHGVPKPLAQYQPTVARAAVDAGADVVLGHHTHCLQGAEVMNRNGRNAVVFYSLGNFAMPTDPHGKHLCAPMGLYTYSDAFYHELQPGHKPEIFTAFWLEGGAARIEAGKNGLESVTFAPTQARSLESGQPRPLASRDAAFRKVVTHMKWASEGLRGAPEFKVRNGEIEIYRR